QQITNDSHNQSASSVNILNNEPLNSKISSQTRIYAKALYDFPGTGEPDELTLEEEDVVELFSSEANNGWLWGEYNGVNGCFPYSYVRILTPEEAIAEGLSDKPRESFSPADQEKQYSTSTAHSNPDSHRPWYNKYKKMPRYDKKKESTISINSESEEKLQMSMSNLNSKEISIQIQTGVSTSDLPSPQAKVALSPQRSPTKRVRPNSAASKQVSIVGAPAGMRPRWVDWMGGNEAVAKLGLSKKEIQRQEVIYEVIATEKDYIEDLGTVIEVYIKQLRIKKLLRPKDMSVIFSNLEQLMPVNQ
ncbi:hypothetical protein HK096_010817, partial [Nowakowskiella sp. JEL0078]